MVRAVVGTISSSAVSVPLPVRVPRKAGHSQKSGREPHGEHEDRLWLTTQPHLHPSG